MREELVLAFARGRGLNIRESKAVERAVRAEAYPLLTRYTTSGRVEEHPVTAAADLARKVEIARIGSRDALIDTAIEAARSGASIAVICNAVDPAIETFETLLAQGAEPRRTHLFHARFAMGDRLAIERDVQAWFGRTGTEDVRRGRILVATQVIEQSLDVDFDVMLSDLAPADLLVQRAGRLWRHQRATRPVPAPVLHILTPGSGRGGQSALARCHAGACRPRISDVWRAVAHRPRPPWQARTRDTRRPAAADR